METYHGLVREPRDWKDLASGAEKVGRKLCAIVIVSTKDNLDISTNRVQHEIVPLLCNNNIITPTTTTIILSCDKLKCIFDRLQLKPEEIISIYIPEQTTGQMRKQIFHDISYMWPIYNYDTKRRKKLVLCPCVDGDIVVSLTDKNRSVWLLPNTKNA